MLMEDIHWADHTTLESIDDLLNAMDRTALLLVATFRPEYKPHWIGQPLVTALTVGRLDPEHTTTIIGHVTARNRLHPDVVS
jgi:predicted ATPase